MAAPFNGGVQTGKRTEAYVHVSANKHPPVQSAPTGIDQRLAIGEGQRFSFSWREHNVMYTGTGEGHNPAACSFLFFLPSFYNTLLKTKSKTKKLCTEEKNNRKQGKNCVLRIESCVRARMCVCVCLKEWRHVHAAKDVSSSAGMFIPCSHGQRKRYMRMHAIELDHDCVLTGIIFFTFLSLRLTLFQVFSFHLSLPRTVCHA